MSTWTFDTTRTLTWLRDQMTYPSWQQAPRLTERIAIGSQTGRAEYSSVGAAPATISGVIYVSAADGAALQTAYRTAAEVAFTHETTTYTAIIRDLKLDPISPDGSVAGSTGSISLSRVEAV